MNYSNKMKKEKKLKAWAIMPSFIDNKALINHPFMAENEQFMIYSTKKAAEKDCNVIDEIVVPCEIVILK